MRSIKGKCHCGNISYEFQLPATNKKIPVRACGCSFCRKHGGVHTSHPNGRLDAHIANARLISKYSFGTNTAEFYVCTVCGVEPFVTSSIDEHLYAVVNVNTFENIDLKELDMSTSDFEGESVESRLERRKKNWIADVHIQFTSTTD